MEQFDQDKPIEFTKVSLDHLRKTRKWTMFLSVLGFIFIGLCIIVIPVVIVYSGMMGKSGSEIFALLPLLLVVCIYFFPVYFLYRFSTNSMDAITNSDSQSLEKALKYLKFYYRFMGILVIVMLAFYSVAGLILLITKSLL
jgi:hypothetical protein